MPGVDLRGIGTKPDIQSTKAIGLPTFRILLSMAPRMWANGVSLFRENVRLNGRHKCHSVRVPWYQMLTSRSPPRVAASEDPRRPGISSRWLCGFPTRARSLLATSPCAWLSESPSIAPSQGTSACAQRWLWACRRRPRCRCCPLDPSRSQPLNPGV